MRTYKGVKYSDINDCIADRGTASMTEPAPVVINIDRGEPGIWATYMEFTYKDISDKKYTTDEFNSMIDEVAKDFIDNERWNDHDDDPMV